MRRQISQVFNKVLTAFCMFGLVSETISSDTKCQLQNGICTYNINLNEAGSCSSPTKTTLEEFDTYSRPQEIRLPADEKMTKMQKDFDVVKSDHENRIKELESSIQKVMRNAISSQPAEYSNNQIYLGSSSRGRESIIESKRPNQESSGNLLLLQLQNQFNSMRTSLSQRTADLLEARNKLNETSDLLKAAQKLSFESSSKLVGLETKAAVLERENRILKNKFKDKSERLEYANEKLNITETKLRSVENQLYDVVRSESNLKEELATVKHILKETQMKLSALQVNHTDLQAKYKKTKLTLKIRDEELIECYKGKTLNNYVGSFKGLDNLLLKSVFLHNAELNSRSQISIFFNLWWCPVAMLISLLQIQRFSSDIEFGYFFQRQVFLYF